MFCLIFRFLSFLVSNPCFLDSSTQNHAESSRNYLKKLGLDPKRAKWNPNSEFGHVRTCQGLSRKTSPCQQSIFLFFRNYIKKSVWDPKHAESNQKSDFGHVRTYCWLNKLRNIQRKIYGKYLGHIYIYIPYIFHIYISYICSIYFPLCVS